MAVDALAGKRHMHAKKASLEDRLECSVFGKDRLSFEEEVGGIPTCFYICITILEKKYSQSW